jgi:flagellar basal-body rod protein FlgF
MSHRAVAQAAVAPADQPAVERGLYVAASGMLAQLARQDQLANDLANANTPGYKADRVEQQSFGALLLHNTRTGQEIGSVGTGTQITRQVTDLSAQALKETGEPLDFAVAGDGFFAVRTAQGIRFTRNGAFQADAQGQLVDQLGNAVLGPGRAPVKVAADGTVDPRLVGLFSVPNARKAGDALFTGTSSGTPTGEVRSGALEGSGLDPARAMIDMIGSLRAFEAGQKAITTIDETLDRATGTVGGLPG